MHFAKTPFSEIRGVALGSLNRGMLQFVGIFRICRKVHLAKPWENVHFARCRFLNNHRGYPRDHQNGECYKAEGASGSPKLEGFNLFLSRSGLFVFDKRLFFFPRGVYPFKGICCGVSFKGPLIENVVL